jgi:hypothetical protein
VKSLETLIGRRCRPAVLLTIVLLSMPVAAVEVVSLYTAEVPFDREAADPRGDAYEAALLQVLLRVSGSGLANDEETVAALFPNPQGFVTQFRPGADDTLWVSFDGQAIERVLRDAGQPMWGAERPLTLVWLAVDWGQGTREIIAADDPERLEQEARSIDRNRMIRERLLEIADRRGLPLVFPLLDTTDLQSVTFADLWGGFDESVLAASRRYDADSILIGRIRPASNQPNRWSYHYGGENVGLSGPPEEVLGQVADMLAAEFAIGGDLPLEMVALHVSGIDSVEAFGDLQRILGKIPIIERSAIAEVSGERVSYRVETRGGAERLSRALRFAGLLEQDPPQEAQFENALEFYFTR